MTIPAPEWPTATLSPDNPPVPRPRCVGTTGFRCCCCGCCGCRILCESFFNQKSGKRPWRDATRREDATAVTVTLPRLYGKRPRPRDETAPGCRSPETSHGPRFLSGPPVATASSGAGLARSCGGVLKDSETNQFHQDCELVLLNCYNYSIAIRSLDNRLVTILIFMITFFLFSLVIPTYSFV
jgi:hypothetical protein